MQEYYKSCSQLVWPFYDLSQLYDLKCQKTHIFAIWVHKCHKSLFLAYLTVFYNCMTWNVRKLISLRSQCTSIANRFLSLITVLQFITAVWVEISENSYLRDLSAEVSRISFLILFDCFTAYYKCKTWNIRKLIFPDLSTQVSQIVFLAYLTVLRLITTVWPEMSENSYLQDFSAQVSQIVFVAYLTVLRLITTVWPEMSENSYLRDFSAQVSQIVCIAYLSVLRLITTLWPEVLKKWYLRNLSEQVSQIVFLAYLRILRLFYNWLT